jgi:multidrug efflux system membrane fusion protein
MKSSYLLACGVAALAAAWILSGQVTDPRQGAHATAQRDPPAATETLPRTVRVRTVEARPWQREVVIRGKTAASRSVKLRAETPGRIGKVLVDEGRRVRAGEALAEIDVAERAAALAEADALLRQRTVEYNAARALAAKGYRSDTKLAEAAAQLDAARARVSQMKTDIARTTIRAPFDGILEKRFVELGDYVKVGDDIGRIVDLDPVLVVGALSEREVALLKVGAEATASLVDGRRLTGTIRFVAAVADPATRTFRVEVELPNADGLIRDGITSQITLPAAEVRAHFLSPSLLSLDERGQLGVKAVGADNRVLFHPIELLADKPGGIWVAGLPHRITLISVGQEFVKPGQRVSPVRDTVEQAS